jgi:hypothetical protein
MKRGNSWQESEQERLWKERTNQRLFVYPLYKMEIMLGEVEEVLLGW